MTRGIDAWIADDLRCDLALRRREVGITQADIARLIGTSQSAISRYESGISDPPLSMLAQYARQVGARLVVTVEHDEPAVRRRRPFNDE